MFKNLCSFFWKSRILVLLLICFSFTVLSCEDVINYELKKSEPRIVIEGTVTEGTGPFYVKVSKTTDYFTPGGYPAVSNAVVTITDNTGNLEILQETGSGMYRTAGLEGIPGRTYFLKVIADGQEYTAESTMPQPIELDSIRYKWSDNFFGEDGYELYCYFNDRKDLNDYVRIKVYQNGELDNLYFMYDDRFTDGEVVKYGFHEDYEQNDVIRMELLTIDRQTFEYYATLSYIVVEEGEEEQSFAGPQENPATNLSNGAFGYFGAFTVRKDSVVIK